MIYLKPPIKPEKGHNVSVHFPGYERDGTLILQEHGWIVVDIPDPQTEKVNRWAFREGASHWYSISKFRLAVVENDYLLYQSSSISYSVIYLDGKSEHSTGNVHLSAHDEINDELWEQICTLKDVKNHLTRLHAYS